jgi:RimJ/RimL family protein N-acetyltransferase
MYRPATLDDAALASDLMSASYPAMAQDPVMTRYRWERPRRGFASGRFIAEQEGHPIGFLAWVHGPWAETADRHCEVEVWLDLAELDRHLLSEMWTWVGDEAIGQGSWLLLASCGEDEPEMLGVLASLGYRQERREKQWELDLNAHGARIRVEAALAREAAAEQGIELTTLARWSDPDRLKKLHELDEMTRQDIPVSLPIVREAYDDFVRRTSSPDRPPDRFWIALDGDQPVALSYLKFPPVRGAVWTGYTCSHPKYRGRGLARGVKLQSLAQAADLRIPLVRTDNDSENAPMLHINERLGYTPRPGFVEHHKRVKT